MAMNVLYNILGDDENRPHRLRYDRSSPLDELDHEQLRARYRCGRAGINFITNAVRDQLKHPTKRSNALSVEMQVLIALRFYATGTFQQVVGDTIQADKSTVSRVIRHVSQVLSSLIPNFIKWPVCREEKMKIQQGFYQNGGFPSVIGSVDGTHIRVQAPSKDEACFVNRKGYHSINVQAICDNEGKFTNLVAKWPGCTHDSHIFRMSTIKHRTMRDGLKLGDSGYACQRYLMTPYLRPSTEQQERFNNAHRRTRTTIERAFGVWKRRFHVLHGEIRMTPERVCNIIGACAVLHNVAIIMKEPVDGVDVDGVNQNHINIVYNGPENGQSVRNHITDTYFR